MLERQHAQLIAGLQKLYRHTQNGGGWTGPRLEDMNHGQPLTHEILEALDVLQTDEWEDSESVVSPWQGLEQQGQGNGWIYSESASPSTQAAFSSTSPTQTSFPQSTIMSKRGSKAQTGLAPITQMLSMPPPFTTTFACVKPEPYDHAFPNQVPTFPDTSLSSEQMNMGLDRGLGSMMDWSFATDDLFGNLGGLEQTVQG